MKYRYDVHIHSCLSPCGSDDMTPATIAGIAKVNGLDIIALTDHNSCKNCQAFLNAANEYEIVALCGMELTTSEDIHVLCLFEDIKIALEFDKYVKSIIVPIKNRPNIFGNQLIMTENDNIVGIEEILLINATELSFDNVHEVVNSYGGVALPAHIDKDSNSVIATLGTIPIEAGFTSYEVANINNKYDFVSLPSITNSDAHYIEHIGIKDEFLDLNCTISNLAKTFINYLKGIA